MTPTRTPVVLKSQTARMRTIAITCGRPTLTVPVENQPVTSGLLSLPPYGDPGNQAPWMICPMKMPLIASTTDQPIQ